MTPPMHPMSTTTPHPLAAARTLLFVPGDRPDRFAKAQAAGAGAIILDLEDAVGAARKAEARAAVLQWLQQRSGPGRVGVRLNAVDTAAGLDDLAAFTRAGRPPGFYVLSKVESAAVVRLYAGHLCAPGTGVELVCGIETAKGLDAARRIASASPAVAMIGFGGGDLARDLGTDGSDTAMLFARSRVVQAAAAAGRTALDMPWIHLDDAQGLVADARRSRALGFRAKLAIHPRQVPLLEQALAPSAEAMAAARRTVDAYRAANGGACTVDGHLVDAANYGAALRLLGEAASPDAPPPQAN